MRPSTKTEGLSQLNNLLVDEEIDIEATLWLFDDAGFLEDSDA
jgi:hypothetical protein